MKKITPLHGFLAETTSSLQHYFVINNILIRSFISHPGEWSRIVSDDLSNFVENDEAKSSFNDEWHDFRGTLLFHDQEPILYNLQKDAWDKFIFTRTAFDNRLVIVHSEINSPELNDFCKDYDAIPIHWFSNGALAHQWYSCDMFRVIGPDLKHMNQIKYKFSCMNRLIGQQRIYRPILSAALESSIDHKYLKLSCNLIDQYSGKHVTDFINDTLPQHHKDIIKSFAGRTNKIAINLDKSEENIDANWAPYLLRRQYFKDVFCHIATETMFYDDTIHLTEKSMRAFVNLRPMILVGPAGSLKYLRGYGFKTFGDFWDESYDEETDSNKRLDKIIELIIKLNKLSIEDMKKILSDMEDILIYNRNHFFFRFPEIIQEEFVSNITSAIKLYKNKTPNGWILQRLASLTKKEFENIRQIDEIPKDIPPEKIFECMKAGSRREQDNNVIRFLHQHIGMSDIFTASDAIRKIHQILD